ncbi:MAG: CHASE2 domain-containing protein [Oligoflexales bacterium]
MSKAASSKKSGGFVGFLSKYRLKLVVVTMSAAIAGLAYFALFYHYRHFNFGDNDLPYTVESKLLDMRIRGRGALKPKAKIGILAIDEKAIRSFGRWPFSRRYYQKAFENLKALGVKWIGFDSIYSEPEKALLEDAKSVFQTDNGGGRWQTNKTSQLDYIKKMMETSPGDAMFKEGIESFQNIVLGFFYFQTALEAKQNLGDQDPFVGLEEILNSEISYDMPEGRKLDDYPLLTKPSGLVANIPSLAKASPYFGFFSNDADNDAINRWVVLVANINGKLVPSLSLKTAAEYLNSDIFVFFDDAGIESIELINRDDDTKIIKVPVDPMGAGRILVNHIGPSRGFQHFSLADAYHNRYTGDEKKQLKDSLLLMGATATGINDMRPNPFDPALDGVENHAAVVENIIGGRFLKRPLQIFEIELLIVLGIGVLFTPILIWSNALFSGIALLGFLSGYYYVNEYVWFREGIWAYMAIPSGQIILMFFTTTLYKYMAEESEKRKVKGAFQYYLSPDVIDQVLEDPDSLALGGEKKELTVFFSDVRGFTTISESLTPEKLCELMNEYFTPMTGIILRSRGVLDKYIGDAIMAFWGAPISLPNAPDVACGSAIEMLYALERLKQDFAAKGFPPIDMGIGLNTGPMSVGNMGSKERFTYTVMGDSVNLGSRLESLTKEYGIRIMLSEFTHRKLTPGKFVTRNLDDIRVKGKNEPVRVFDLVRPDYIQSPQDLGEFIQTFNAGREFYRSRNWVKANECFLTCLRLKSDDKASNLYVKRIETFKEEPPVENWDGVYTFTHK